MKIVCEACVQNRLAPHVKIRRQQSTIAIGLHPPGSKDPDNVFIIHFSASNKNGTRYKIRRNIEKVFTTYINDGKTTISFKSPEHNLQILANPLQLKNFLTVLKLAVEGKIEPQKLGLSTLAVTAVPKSNLPVKKMTILKPSEYPVKGLPRTLEALVMSGIRKHSIDTQILNLAHLRVLQMNNNCIPRIPKKLGEMHLTELDLSQNNLGVSDFFKDWSWCDGPIRKTLQNLNLSSNNLQYLPYKIVKLDRLHTLTLNDNEIRHVPFAFRRLKHLRYLNLANNQLSALPDVFANISLNTLNVSGAQLFPVDLQRVRCERPIQLILRQPASLWQLAARLVISNKVPYSERTLPSDIIDLLEEAPFCSCRKLCMPQNKVPLTGVLAARAVQIEATGRTILYRNSVYCSDYCKSMYCTFTYQ